MLESEVQEEIDGEDTREELLMDDDCFRMKCMSLLLGSEGDEEGVKKRDASERIHSASCSSLPPPPLESSLFMCI